MAAAPHSDSIARDAVRSLEARLRRIEYLLAGTCEDPIGELEALDSAGRDNAVVPRLSSLERELSRIIAKSQSMKDLLQLYTAFPEIFKSASTNQPGSDTLGAAEKAAVVLSSAPEYHAACSQLSSVMDTPLPDTAVLTALIELFPRIHRAGVVQEVQAERLGQLRSRSVAVLERWYLVGIEGVNECFVEWDERAFLVDKAIHQRLSRRETEN